MKIYRENNYNSIGKIKYGIQKKPYLYSLSKKIMEPESYKKNVTKKTTDFCLEAYPSSGNTFLLFLMKNINSNINLSHHTHTLANIKLAKLHNVPCLIIVRDPLEAISSYIFRFVDDVNIDDEIVKYEIIKYQEFYTYVYNNKEIFNIIDFNDLVKLPERTMMEIIKHTSIVSDECKLDWNSIIEKSNADVKAKALDKGRFTKGSFPSEEKEKGKRRIKELIKESENYEIIKKLYHDLLEVTVNE